MANLLQRAGEATACSMLNDVGSAGTQLAVWMMWKPVAAAVPLTVGALSYMANNLLCQDMDPPTEKDDRLDGCTKGAPGQGYPLQYWVPDTNSWGNSALGLNEITSVGEVVYRNGKWGHWVEGLMADGDPFYSPGGFYDTEEEAIQYGKYRLNVPDGECEGSNDPTDPGNPSPDFPEYDYTDPVTNCNYTLKLEGFVQQYEYGPAQPVWLIQSASGARAGGGRMGGCNLSPTIFIGGNGDGTGGPNGPPQLPQPPNPPGPGPNNEPWWLDALASAIGGVLLEKVVDAILEALEPPMLESSFTLNAPCDKDADGNQLTRTWDFPVEKFGDRLISHQEALMEIMQQHLDWKTPTCRENRPEKRGTWISTHWRSDADSPNSNRPLRKLFRYRSESTRTTDELQAYWSDFEWTSGPVCVIHKGAWWGTPQVWAATAEEGQRVIRRAGSEAGLDPDQTGEWLVSSSDSPRYGMSLKMRLDEESGERWVTRREGPSGFPEL